MDEKKFHKSNKPIWKDEIWRKEAPKKVLTMGLLLIAGFLYFITNHYNDFRFADSKPFIFAFPIDQAIPLTRFFILPYFYWYFVIVFTVLLLFFQKDSRYYYKLVFSMSSGVFLSSIVFFVFPTYLPRPELMGDDFLTGMIRFIYAADPPYNCFPSMHVLYAFVCAWYLAVFKRIGWWFDLINAVGFILICLSTVYTKQHYTPDILGGVVLGAAVCCFYTFIVKPRRPAPVE